MATSGPGLATRSAGPPGLDQSIVPITLGCPCLDQPWASNWFDACEDHESNRIGAGGFRWFRWFCGFRGFRVARVG